MSHKTKVLVNFIQDRSGSMTPVWEETLNGFKCFLNDLREKGAADGIDYLFSLTTFDALIDTPCIGESIDKVDENLLAKFGLAHTRHCLTLWVRQSKTQTRIGMVPRKLFA